MHAPANQTTQLPRFVTASRLHPAKVRKPRSSQAGNRTASAIQTACAPSCHDPHFVPSPAEKASWFHAKCQTCHDAAVCGRGNNCIACHMPASSVTDAEHVVYTDHSIPQRATPRNQKTSPSTVTQFQLATFAGTPTTPRDQGLAYAIVAIREQNALYATRAFELLKQAERQNPNDPQTLSYLADPYKARKDDQNAVRLFQRLYAVDPTQSSAMRKRFVCSKKHCGLAQHFCLSGLI